MKIKNPWNNEIVGEVKDYSKQEVQEAFENAKKFNYYSDQNKRAGWLKKAADLLKQRKQEFAELITAESGICIKSTLHEVDRAIEVLEESAKWTRKRVNLSEYLNSKGIKTNICIEYDIFPFELFEKKGKKYFVFYEPIGLISSITPFNHPLNQVVTDIGPAIAAGNNIVLKPSGKTPLTAVKFGKLLKEAGIPEYNVQIITGNVEEIGDEMITNKNIDMLSFTGGTKIGEYIANKVGVKRTCLELGGNDPLIICNDADLNKTIEIAINGAFGNSGQRCTAIKRIIILPEIVDKFVEKFVEKVKELKYGNPMDPQNYIGTVIDEDAARLFEARVEKAIQEGAKLLYGHKREGALYAPTVLDFVNPKSELVIEETFGPVAPIIRAQNLDEAIEIANSTIYGLQAGIITSDINNLIKAGSRIKTGASAMNNGPHCYRPPEVPFGGIKKSGHGKKGVKYGMFEMSNLKWISIE